MKRLLRWIGAAALLAASGNASASVLYVYWNAPGANTGADWGNAYLDLQSALAYARTHPAVSEIRVASGTYTPGTLTSSTFSLPSNVKVRGGFAPGAATPNPSANPTVLSGNMSGLHAHHVVTSNSTTNATIEGFVISDGQDDSWATGKGGGILVANSSFLIVRNCTIKNNNADRGGGVYALYSTITFDACTFSSNSSNYWAGTSGDGGAVYLENSEGSSTFNCCTFDDNFGTDGGAICGLQTIFLINSIFRGNTAQTLGGAISVYESAYIYDCAFSGNAASDYGGAIYGWTPDVVDLANCTLAGNTAGTRGGGIDVNAATFSLANSILWDNNAHTFEQCFSVYVYIPHNNCIEGLSSTTDANGNFGLDPLFVSATGTDGAYGTADDNLRLRRTSPCAGKGSNHYAHSTIPDLDGRARVSSHILGLCSPPSITVDIGAFEIPCTSSPGYPGLPSSHISSTDEPTS